MLWVFFFPPVKSLIYVHREQLSDSVLGTPLALSGALGGTVSGLKGFAFVPETFSCTVLWSFPGLTQAI